MGALSCAMSDHPKRIVCITVYAPERGKLGLKFLYADGSSRSCMATVSTIRLVLADHGRSISVEMLAEIAFLGHQLVLREPVTSIVALPAPSSRNG